MIITKDREKYIDQFIQNSLNEDIGDGDHTSLACVPKEKQGKAELIIKEAGIFAGIEFADKIFKKVDKLLVFKKIKADGDLIKPGDIAFTVEGNALSILKSERLVLNVIQRMSGIATQVYNYTKKLEGLKTKILDTRKTTPGMRILERDAVRIGGGKNHRMGLFDMILIKDNHKKFSGGIINAIQATHKYLKENNKTLK